MIETYEAIDLICGTCKEFKGKYVNCGTNHLMGFRCKECLNKKEDKK